MDKNKEERGASQPELKMGGIYCRNVVGMKDLEFGGVEKRLDKRLVRKECCIQIVNAAKSRLNKAEF